VPVIFQKPDCGSTTSLQDSGISEHEGGATGGQSGQSSPLSKLPGMIYSILLRVLKICSSDGHVECWWAN
jgi:hypothetical protein